MAPMYEHNMEEVLAADELIPEGIYRWRVASYEEQESTKGNPMLVFRLKCQDEGVAFGRETTLWCSLVPTGLFTLKSLYKACGYDPKRGHDPDQILDCELYGTIVHKKDDNGVLRANIPAYSMKPITGNPYQS